MRKIREGGTNHSFGIHVAQLAGMPNRLAFRSNEILRFHERDKHKNEEHRKFHDVPKPSPQMSLFETDPRMKDIQTLLETVDINTMSPVEALLKLNEVISIVKKQ